jgi:hypothetical protein
MKHIIRVIAHWGLLLHIYISMAGFTLVILFAVTGLTLNHQDFGLAEPRTTQSTSAIDGSMLESPNSEALSNYLKGKLGIRTPLTDYHEDPDQIELTFAAPGHRTVVTINRAEKSAAIETETRGLLGRLDDLHKGFDSGTVWYWTIDFTAILLTASSLTGMITLVSLRARRRSGFAVAGLGVAMVLIIYLWFIPR